MRLIATLFALWLFGALSSECSLFPGSRVQVRDSEHIQDSEQIRDSDQFQDSKKQIPDHDRLHDSRGQSYDNGESPHDSGHLHNSEGGSSRRRRKSDNYDRNLEFIIEELSKEGVLEHMNARLQTVVKKIIDTKSQKHNLMRKPRSNKDTNRLSFLDRSRSRQQRLFGRQNRPSLSKLQTQRTFRRPGTEKPKNKFPFPSLTKNSDQSVTCQALKIENKILKEQLDKSNHQKLAPVTAIDVLKQLQNNGHFKIQPSPLQNQRLFNVQPSPSANIQQNPLEKLLQQQPVEGGFQNLLTKRILITPTPTISTLLETSSYLATLTVNQTREIEIQFHGKKIQTHIIEEEIQVKTVTSTQTRTVEVTPTPTWQTITVTPTATIPPPSPTNSPHQALLLKQQLELEKQQLLERIHRLNNQQLDNIHPSPQIQKGIPAIQPAQFKNQPPQQAQRSSKQPQIPSVPFQNLSSLKSYLENIRREKTQEEAVSHNNNPVVVEPSIAEPQASETAIATTSISTVYKSGSVPGEFSTSLVTITLGKEQDISKNRFKRDIDPVIMTRMPGLQEHLLEPKLVSSLGISRTEDQCVDRTVTVTVTSSRKCHQSHP